MDDESWTIFRDKVNKVYSDKRYFRIILIWRFVYILLFPVIDLLRRYTDPTTTHITGLALSLFWLFTFFLLMYYTGPRARKRIHDGLVAVCGEQNASCPDISFQPIYEWGRRYGPDDDLDWLHYIQVQIESDVETS